MLTSFRRHLVIAVLAAAAILMSLLIVEQGRIIDSQRALIHQLFRDSLELNAMRIQLVRHRARK